MLPKHLIMQDIRSCMMDCIRTFFCDKGYRQVETPCLAPAVIPESSIDIFCTEYRSFHTSRMLYALPSPEYYMKQLLSHGSGSIFQISRCFRNTEVLTPQHNPEFTMLEWYTVDADYLHNLAIQAQLLEALIGNEQLARLIQSYQDHNAHTGSASSASKTAAKLAPPIESIPLQQAFERWAGIDLEQGLKKESLPGRRSNESLADAFHRILVDDIEPNLPVDRPVALIDYPAIVPTTGKMKPGTPWVERWELYLGGIEIANCYSEAAPQQLHAYCRSEAHAMQQQQRYGQADAEYARLCPQLPVSSGNALGIDRLLMQLTGETHIEGVILFPLHATIRP